MGESVSFLHTTRLSVMWKAHMTAGALAAYHEVILRMNIIIQWVSGVRILSGVMELLQHPRISRLCLSVSVLHFKQNSQLLPHESLPSYRAKHFRIEPSAIHQMSGSQRGGQLSAPHLLHCKIALDMSFSSDTQNDRFMLWLPAVKNIKSS